MRHHGVGGALATQAKETTTSTWGRIEVASKILLAIAAMAYAVGVVVVSSDLARYDIATFSLARSQYILVGATWLGMTIILLLGPALGAYSASQVYRPRSREGTKIAFRAIVGGTVAVVMLAQSVSPATLSMGEKPELSIIFRVPAVAFMEVLSYYLFYSFWSVKTAELDDSLVLDLDDRPKRAGQLGGLILLLIFLLPPWIPIYVNLIYQGMGPELGGGKHPCGKVVFRQPDKQDANELKEALGPICLQGLTTKDDVVVVSEGAKPTGSCEQGTYCLHTLRQAGGTRINFRTNQCAHASAHSNASSDACAGRSSLKSVARFSRFGVGFSIDICQLSFRVIAPDWRRPGLTARMRRLRGEPG